MKNQRHSPEQKRAETIEQILAELKAESPEQALEVTRALLNEEPLTLTVSVNRRSGRLGIASNLSNDGRRENELRLLADALALAQKQVQEALVQAAEERGKKSASGDASHKREG